MVEAVQSKRNKNTRFRELILNEFSKVKIELLTATFCMLGYIIMTVATPWPLKLIFDHILLNKPAPESMPLLEGLLAQGIMTALVILSVCILVIASLRGAFSYFQTFITARIGYLLVFALRQRLFQHLQSLSLSFHNRSRSGEILSKLTNDTTALKDVFSESILTVATHMLIIISMFTIMMFLNWKLGLIVLSTFPVMFIVLYILHKKIKLRARRLRKQEGKIASRVSEIIRDLPTIQAYGRERYESERFDNANSQNMEEGIRTARLEAAGTRLTEIIGAIGTFMVIMFGSLQVINGAMTPGDVLIFAAYITSIYKPIRHLSKLTTKFSKAAVSVERISDIFDIEPDIRDAPDAIKASNLKGKIVFDHVNFSYDTESKAILKNISFTMEAGQKIALVGASGAGKSTIANLLLRLYDPKQGSIKIDDVDLRKYQRESLREQIGIVPQSAFLFRDTIRENIAYGRLDASDEEIEHAARLSLAHDFIIALPNGYDTIIGEAGCTLSGGQRQRISLARALLKQPSILLMDEPTAALDAESEKQVQDAFKQAFSNHTTLMIAHNFSAIQGFDQILVIKDGCIIEQGHHDKLIAQGGYYYELFCLQKIPYQQSAQA